MKQVLFCICMYVCLTFGSRVSAQDTISTQFIYSKGVQEINFPQFDLCLPLPAGAGYKLPVISGKNILLETDNQIYYYLDLDHITDVELFELKYSLSAEDETDYLSMYILPANADRIKHEIAYLIGQFPKGTYKELPSIPAGLGEFKVFRMKLPNEHVYESYILSGDSYSYMFRLSGAMDIKKKKEYENIIRGIAEKNLAYRRIRYEAKLKGDNLAFSKDADAAQIRLADNQGILLKPFTFKWADPGVTLVIPSGFKYQIGGEMSYQASDRVDILTEKSSKIGSNLSRFYNENISVNITDHLSYISAENSIRSRVQSAKYSDTLDIVVDGLPMSAIFYGGNESGILTFCIETEEDIREIAFGGVTNHTLPSIERIISSIRLDIPKQGLYTRRNVSIASLLKLAGPNDISLDEPLALSDLPKEMITLCNLTDLGIRLQLRGNVESYNYGNLGNASQIKNGIIRGIPKESLRIWSSDPDVVSYTIVREEMKLPLEKDIIERKREWANYKNTEVIHASLTRVNGVDWSLFFFRAGEKSYGGIMTAYKGDYKITLNIPYQTEEEEAFKKAAFIKSVWYKILPDYK